MFNNSDDLTPCTNNVMFNNSDGLTAYSNDVIAMTYF